MIAPESTAQKPTKTMLVAWALGESGGDREGVDKCDVAVFAFRAYRDYFGFKKYPEYPDVDAVRVQLDDMMKPKYSRGFGLDRDVPITEKVHIGPVAHWKLTEDGRQWYQSKRDQLRDWVEHNAQSEFKTTKTERGSARTEADAINAWVRKIRETAGFQKWVRDPSVTRRQIGIQTFFTAFGIGPRTRRPDYLQQREKMYGAVKPDPQALEFLHLLDKMFADDYSKILAGEVEI